LGAKNRFILFQFLFEAVILSVIGGLIGLILVWLISIILSNVLDFEFVLGIGNIHQSISDFDLNKDLDLVAIGKGKYKIYVNAVQWQDQVPQNNTLTGLFWVDEKTSITQESIEGIRFSPNPCQGLLCIHNPNAITTEVEILDPQGRVCMKVQLNQSQHIMNLESLATGVYYLKIGTKTSKLLVEQK
jgi:hypothetical protein